MKYTDLSKEQIERVFAEDVLGWEYECTVHGEDRYKYIVPNTGCHTTMNCHPLTNLDHAFLGLKYLGLEWTFSPGEIGVEAAIVEACIRVVRPDLFEGGL